MIYSVEWSNTLMGAWSTVGVTSSVWLDGATTQQIKATVPAGVTRTLCATAGDEAVIELNTHSFYQ